MTSLLREVGSFPLPPKLVGLLVAAGYRYGGDIDKEMRPFDLAKEIHCTNQEALSIIRTIHGNRDTLKGTTAFELLHQQTEMGPIVTFCSAIDSMLGGGIPRGKITEFCGVPGVGKTQLG